MKQILRAQQGFTLVEIMLVVVIIGLLAAMAVPAWQRVRLGAITSTMDNDARQLAGAAQQYFLEYRVTTVALTYTDGAIGGPLAEHVRFIGTHYTDVPTELVAATPFSLNHPHLPAARTYSEDGQHTP
ncbi:MAG TPA: type II secretion system protein [Bryobacteraceae bacterium]|nr:type II secretion system protein [Bryobacteraceae bacterium]